MKQYSLLLSLLLTVCTVWGQSNVQELELKISKIRKELLDIEKERTRVKDEVTKDRNRFQEYRKRTAQKIRTLEKTTLSIDSTIALEKIKKDSLSSVYNVKIGKQKTAVLKQDGFRKNLLQNCQTLQKTIELLPPLVKDKINSSLQVLKTEINDKSVENLEAVGRFFQIARNIDNAAGNIQVIQGTSPLSTIRGLVYRIRIGLFYEAIVDTKGVQAAIFTGYDKDGKAQWNLTQDPAVAGKILNAINIREGKSMPALAELPFSNTKIMKGTN